jgi:sporulation protein YabP
MEQANINTKSNLSLTARNVLSLSGVKKVKSTEPSNVIAVLDNCQIIIQGSNLNVQNVNIPSGILELTGQVNSIRYTGSSAKKFSFRNMFR